MAKSDFKIGDVVVLKSGSPKMTVREIQTQGYKVPGGSYGELDINEVIVEWFEDGEIKKAMVMEPQLELLVIEEKINGYKFSTKRRI